MRKPTAPRIELGGALVLVMLAAACGRSEPARLEVRPLPAIAEAGGIAARFQLRNAGGRALALDEAVPACGCLPTSRLPESLAPGTATMLDVYCGAPRAPGTVVRELRLRSNDPSSPETALRVTLAGTAAGPEPAALYLGYVAVGESAARDVVVPLAVVDVPPPAHPDVALEPLPVRADGTHAVRVRFTPRAAGVLRASIALGPGAGNLPVTAVAYDAIMAFPAEVRLPRPTGASGLPGITLVGRGAAPLAIGAIDYPDGMSGELRTVVPGKQFRLVLRGRGPTGAADAAIRVRGASGDPLLVIPVVAGTAGDGSRPRT